jgi:hypothetical protein
VVQGRFLVLELAALLDRLEAAAARAASPSPEDPRIAILRRAIAQLPSAPHSTPRAPARTERILTLYSELAAAPH